MSEIRKYIALIESAILSEDSSSLEASILGEWDNEYEDIDELIDAESIEDVIEHLLDVGMKKELEYLLDEQNIGVDVYQSHGNDNAAIYALSNNIGIIRSSDGKHYYVYTDPDRLVYDTDEDFVLSFFNYDEDAESDDFWKSVGENKFAYHATNEENVDSILKHGLEVRNDSRGITNKGTGSAVFTTLNIEELDQNVYGDAHIKINLNAMKNDGYMPKVMEEEPLIIDRFRSAIAHMFDMEYEGGNNDLSPNTLVIFGNIPPKYLEMM